MTEEKNNINESNCPICGYFVGVSSTCTRCGARCDTRISVKAVRRIALFGSVIGLMLLWLAAYLKQPEAVKIGDITETMNNGLVVIEGRVTRILQDEEKNSLKITLDDGTGNIKLNAFNKLNKFRNVLGEDMPALYDTIRVTGALNISQAWGISMFLSIPSRIKIIEKYIIREKLISNITKEDEGERYWIEAEIVEYEEFITRKGFVLHKFKIGDDSSNIPMVLFSTEFESIEEGLQDAVTHVGNRFRILGEVSVFRKSTQIKLVNPKNIEFISSKNGYVFKKKPKKKQEKQPVRTAIDLKSLKKKKIGSITMADSNSIYIISARVKGVNLGGDGVYLSLGKDKQELFISYSDQERIPDFSKLNSGRAVITAAMRVVAAENRIGFSLADIDSVKIE